MTLKKLEHADCLPHSCLLQPNNKGWDGGCRGSVDRRLNVGSLSRRSQGQTRAVDDQFGDCRLGVLRGRQDAYPTVVLRSTTTGVGYLAILIPTVTNQAIEILRFLQDRCNAIVILRIQTEIKHLGIFRQMLGYA